MGILTNFLIANPDDAAAILQAESPDDSWATLELDGVDPVKLDVLYEIVAGVVHDKDAPEQVSLLAGDEEGGQIVFGLSSAVIQALADVREEQIPRIAEEWLASDDMDPDLASEDWAKEAIGLLSAHARLAAASGKVMLLHMVL